MVEASLSYTEDAPAIHELIMKLYQLAGVDSEGEPYTPETAHDFDQEMMTELMKDEHAFFMYAMFTRLPSGMRSQDGGQPWFLFWLTNALEVCN
jgi:hypothetical protein